MCREEGEGDLKTNMFPLQNTVVRLEAVFYGPVGGANCLLKFQSTLGGFSAVGIWLGGSFVTPRCISSTWKRSPLGVHAG